MTVTAPMISRRRVKRNFLKYVKWALRAAVCLLLVLQVILLWWLFSSSEPQPPQPSLPNEEQEVYLRRPDGKGGEVRVMAVVVSTHITDELCINVASAYMSGLPTVVIGYDYPNFLYFAKMNIVLATLAESGLSDDDVLIFTDSDSFFTGMDPLPFIDRFIAESAARPRDVDPRAVREGRKMAPFVVSTESNCYGPQLYLNWSLCRVDFDTMINASKAYAEEHGMELAPRVRSHLNNMRYVNSGTVVARVWALREVYQAIVNYSETHSSLYRGVWKCDQSVVGRLYKDLRVWEMDVGALLADDRAQWEHLRSPSGLRAGVMQLDELQELSAPFAIRAQMHYQLSNEHWPEAKGQGVLTYDIPFRENEYNNSLGRLVHHSRYYLIDDKYIRRVYQQSGGPASFTKRRVHGGSGVIDIAPPLLSLKPRDGVDVVDGVTHRVFPMMAHMPGRAKVRRVGDALPFVQWYVPMMFNDDSRRRAEEFLSGSHMQLWSTTNHSRVSYRTVCATSLRKLKISI